MPDTALLILFSLSVFPFRDCARFVLWCPLRCLWYTFCAVRVNTRNL